MSDNPSGNEINDMEEESSVTNGISSVQTTELEAGILENDAEKVQKFLFEHQFDFTIDDLLDLQIDSKPPLVIACLNPHIDLRIIINLVEFARERSTPEKETSSSSSSCPETSSSSSSSDPLTKLHDFINLGNPLVIACRVIGITRTKNFFKTEQDYQNYKKVIKYLVRNGANVNSEDSSGYTPLLALVAKNEVMLARWLVDKCDADPMLASSKDSQHLPPLIQVAKFAWPRYIAHDDQDDEDDDNDETFKQFRQHLEIHRRRHILHHQRHIFWHRASHIFKSSTLNKGSQPQELCESLDPIYESKELKEKLQKESDEEEIRKKRTSIQNEEEMKELFVLMMRKARLHPFKILDEREDPFIVTLAEATGDHQAIETALCGLHVNHSSWGGFTYTNFNYSMQTKEGYDYLTSPEGRKAIFKLMDCENKLVLRSSAVTTLIDVFWNQFLRRIVIFELLIYLGFLMSLILVVNLTVEQLLTRGQFILIAGMVLFFSILFQLDEVHDMRHQGWTRFEFNYWKDKTTSIYIPAYGLEASNYFDWASVLTIQYIIFSLLFAHHDEVPSFHPHQKQAMSFALLILYLKGLEYASVFGLTSPTARMFLSMGLAILRYLIVVALFLFSFGQCFYLVMFDENNENSVHAFSNIFISVLTLYRGLLGHADFGDLSNEHSWRETVFLYLLFTLTGIVLLMNLFVAFITNAYEDVKSDTDLAFLISRAHMISKKIHIFIRGQHKTSWFLASSMLNWNNSDSEFKSEWEMFIRNLLFNPDPGVPGVREPSNIGETKQFQDEIWKYGVVMATSELKVSSGDDIKLVDLDSKIKTLENRIVELASITEQVKQLLQEQQKQQQQQQQQQQKQQQEQQ